MFGFAGQWGGYTDAETGLVLMTHRYYDPNAGRFLTRDPAHYFGGINLYCYTENNPVNRRDPEGTSAESSLAEAKSLDGESSDGSTIQSYATAATISDDPYCKKMGYVIHRLCDDKFPLTGNHCTDLDLEAKRAVGCCLARILRDRKCGGWDDENHKTTRNNQCKYADRKVKQYQRECVPCKP